MARLEAEGLSPSPMADKTTLIRRVSLDLTGLPPTLGETDAFLADASQEAYEKVVDRLLDSPRYGEHMARFWLDAARYGDTHGLHLDNYREAWPYRDWVIHAFNANKPFDRFIVEQLAGDLLPDTTRDQLIATGYNRCHVSTSEGGSIEEEVYVRNIVDQVDTNGTVFLGLSTGCARCHDHKYDPIRSKDYYQLFAFFNNIDGPALDGNSARSAPIAQVPNEKQAAAIRVVDAQIAELKKAIAAEAAKITFGDDMKTDVAESAAIARSDFVWIDDALPWAPAPRATGHGTLSASPTTRSSAAISALRNTAQGLNQRFFDNAGRKLKVGTGDTLFAYVYIDPKNPPRELMLQWHTSKGWAHRAYWGENVIDWGADGTPERLRIGDLPAAKKWVRLEVPVAKLKLKAGTIIDGWAFTQYDGTVYWDKAGISHRYSQDGQVFDSLAAWVRAQRASRFAGLPANIKAIIALKPSSEPKLRPRSCAPTSSSTPIPRPSAILGAASNEARGSRAQRKQLDDQVPTTLVFRRSRASRSLLMCSSEENTTSAAKRSTAPCPRFCRRFPPGRRSTGWDWPNG